MGAYNDVITIVGSFLPCFFQVSFELLDSLVKGSIIIKAFRLEQTLQPRSIVSEKANKKSAEKGTHLPLPSGLLCSALLQVCQVLKVAFLLYQLLKT